MTHIINVLCYVQPTSQTYTLSLHDALPISVPRRRRPPGGLCARPFADPDPHSDSHPHPDPHALAHGHRHAADGHPDRKSTRLNSSHLGISYAVFCLKKKTK